MKQSRKVRKARDVATREILRNPELMRQIRESEAGNKGLTFEEVFGEPLLPKQPARRK
jgi:hypothetical protein